MDIVDDEVRKKRMKGRPLLKYFLQIMKDMG